LETFLDLLVTGIALEFSEVNGEDISSTIFILGRDVVDVGNVPKLRRPREIARCIVEV